MRKITGQQGFTLIELLLTVGIIGVIAAIAVPNFINYQARSRRSEAFTNLAGLATAQKAFQAERNAFHDSVLAGPGTDVPDPLMYGGWGTKKMPWDADAQTAFQDLGWGPEGPVNYSYASYTFATPGIIGPNCTVCELCFTAAAYGDVDGDGSPQVVIYVHPDDVMGMQAYCHEGLLNLGPATGSGGDIFDAVAARSNSDF